MKRNTRSGLVFGALLVLAVSAYVGAQTAIQRPRSLDPKVFSSVKAIPPSPPSSAMHSNPPDPVPNEPDWQGKHEPLTLHVAEAPNPGRPTMISVSRADGGGFFFNREPGVVQVYSPYYKLKRVDRTLDIATFVFGNETVESKVKVSPNGSLFTLTLACQRNDPDIPASAQFDRRPFLVIVSRKDPQSGIVLRGEATVTLTGYIVEKP